VNSSDIQSRLDAIESLLDELGGELLDLQSQPLDIATKSTEVDLVTKADLHSEARLDGFIRNTFPDDLILSEEADEADAPDPREDDFLWVIDPIDGTTNYANRLPLWSISIGLHRGGQTVGGIVAAPGLDLRYRAILGEGATCNGEFVHVNEKARLSEGLVVTGFPYDRAKRARHLAAAIEDLLSESVGVRRLGSAALDFCFVADGRMTGYYEMGLKPWDACAGALIATEAGARITDFTGGDHDIFASKGVVASNRRVHDELITIVSSPMSEAVAID